MAKARDKIQQWIRDAGLCEGLLEYIPNRLVTMIAPSPHSKNQTCRTYNLSATCASLVYLFRRGLFRDGERLGTTL